MKLPLVRFIYDRRKRATCKKPGTVELEISFASKQKRISTGVYVFPHQWDSEKHIVQHPDSIILNIKLDGMKKSVTDYIASTMISGETFSFDGLNSAIAIKKLDGSFRKFVEERISERTDITESTRKNHRTFLPALDNFSKIMKFSYEL